MGSCHKEQFTTKGALSFSSDTLTFDTVFTTLGSTTKIFKVRNTQSKSIHVSDIKLMQLQGSQFRINVDGVAGTEFKNIDIPAHDSIYVFVEVTINPNSANNPFVIFDQIQFITNGITQNVALEAMGQNAYYHFSEHVLGGNTTTFHADRPHIIVNRNGGLPIFAIDTNATLIIEPKCQIYLGPNALITVDGTLNAHGNDWNDSIVFQYIRHDYPNAPGQWLGITYSRIGHINMDHVVIDQSTFGISDEYVLDVIANAQITTSNLTHYSSDPNIPTVTLDKCIIRNCSSSALTAIRTTLHATNCLFHSSGGKMIVFAMGGTYTVNNCTMANVYNYYTNHQDPTLTIANGVQYIDKNFQGPFQTVAIINNSAVVGSLNSELYVASTSVTATFQYCNLTVNTDSFHLIQPLDSGCVFNSNTGSLFRAPYYNDYTPDSTTSPLYGFTTNNTFTTDLFDYRRTTPKSFTGAIEWHH